MGAAIWSSTMVLVSVSLLSGRPLLSGPSLVLFVAIAVALRTLDIERRERKAKRAIARHRAARKARTVPIRRHDSSRVF